MNRHLPAAILLSCAIAAGWWLEAWLIPVPKANRSAIRREAPLSLTAFRHSGQSTAKLAELAALLRKASDSELKNLAGKLKSLPPGAARELVKAVIRIRRALDHSEDAAGDEPLPTSQLPPPELPPSLQNPADLAPLDPQAAVTLALKMPPGEERSNEVDAIARAMAQYDPAAAMEFVLQAGERRAGEGTASAWARLLLKDVDAAGTVLKRMDAFQRDSMFAALAKRVKSDGLPDSEGSAMDDEHLSVLSHSVMEMAETPGKQALLLELYRRQPTIHMERTDEDGDIAPDKFPEQAVLVTAMIEKLIAESPEKAVMALNGAPNLSPEGNAAVLNNAAPVILPQLCQAGRLGEAVQMLERVKDTAAWRAGFNEVLPYWMDSDPVAARAAFDAAPLTALERERWLRSPAFMLHPVK